MRRLFAGFALCTLLGGGIFIQAAQAELSASAILLGTEQGIEPIAIYSHASKRFSSPPDSMMGKNALIQHFFKEDQELSLYQFGEVKNLFKIKQLLPKPGPCSAFGVLNGVYAAPPSSHQFSLGFTSQFPGVKEYIGTYPTFAFHAQVKKMALKNYRLSGATAAMLQRVHWDKITPFTLKNGTQVLIGVESHIPSVRRGSCPEYSQFSVIEKIGRGYRYRLKRVTQGCKTNKLISSFSTHHSVDKILIQTKSLTQLNFEIYQSNHQGRLLEIFKGKPQLCKP